METKVVLVIIGIGLPPRQILISHGVSASTMGLRSISISQAYSTYVRFVPSKDN